MRAVLAALMALALIPVGSVFAAPVSHPQDVTPRRFGISMSVSRTWDFRFYRRPGRKPVVQAANFRLPPAEVEDDAATLADHGMGKHGILLALEEFPHPGNVHYRALRPPLHLRHGDFASEPVEGVLANHAFAFVAFRTSGRYFQLRAYFGTRPASRGALTTANRVLGSLRIASS